MPYSTQNIARNSDVVFRWTSGYPQRSLFPPGLVASLLLNLESFRQTQANSSEITAVDLLSAKETRLSFFNYSVTSKQSQEVTTVVDSPRAQENSVSTARRFVQR